MNKILKIIIPLLIGIGLWMIYEGVGDWVKTSFKLSMAQYIWTGTFIVLITLFLVKYRPDRYFF
jgi:predicted transglutaminase-like protease